MIDHSRPRAAGKAFGDARPTGPLAAVGVQSPLTTEFLNLEVNQNLTLMRCSPQYMACCLILSLLICSSCSTTKVVTKYDCNTAVNNTVNARTTWTFAWGLVQPKDIDPKCEPSFNHLNKVVVKTNLGYILISAITLGGIIPQRVEWCCAPQNIPTDTLGTSLINKTVR